MEERSIAKECGIRCKRRREALNMSQAELAEKIFVTPQSISKYEKEGISNIDTIKKLSYVLCCNLLDSAQDVEGKTGEVGREILTQLVNHRGYLEVNELINKFMFGMDMNRVSKEISKIEEIGLCVREQYLDFYDQHKDGLFITAKGLITYKNSTVQEKNEEFYKQIKGVKTLEQIIGSVNSFQEYVDNHQVEKIIRQLYGKGTYREDYISYLYFYFTTRIGQELRINIPSERHNCFFDLWFRENMDVDPYVYEIDSLFHREEDEEDDEPEYYGSDPVIEAIDNLLRHYASFYKEDSDGYLKYLNDISPDKDEDPANYVNINMKKLYKSSDNDLLRFYSDVVNFYPSQLDKYIYPASNEEELAIDEKIAIINQLCPETLEYYNVTEKWEKYGIGARIRRAYHMEREGDAVIEEEADDEIGEEFEEDVNEMDIENVEILK